MSPLAGPLHAVALALALAGAAKVARPAGTAAALRAIGLPARRWWPRVLGVVELGIAGWVLAGGGAPAAAALAAAHLGFLVVALLLQQRAATCGCFGDGSAPVTAAHLVTNVVCLAVAVVSSLDPVGGLAAVDGVEAVPYLGLVALLAWLEVLALTALPEVQASARRLRNAA